MDKKGQSTEYAPPPGPPPGHRDNAATPAEPPPSYQLATGSSSAAVAVEPPPYPPPPGLNHNFSSGANATKDEANQAHMWCEAYPLTPPYRLPPHQLRAIHAHNHELLTPPGFRGTVTRLDQVHHTWRISTAPGCKDSLMQTALPCFSHFADSPMFTERPKTLYFEIAIRSLGATTEHSRLGGMLHRHAANEECGVAVGYFAPPYPAFRLPGWQRGSLGVHSDDGRRYVGNTDGGVDFTRPFHAGETIGIGMTFDIAQASKGPAMNIEVFLTRDGRKAGGWNLLNDTDSEFESVFGLTGDNDIFPAVGVFGPVDIELRLGEGSWQYRGWNQSV